VGEDETLTIEWFGHSYFRLKTSNFSLAIDPHDGGSLNLPEFRVHANAAISTHNHYDHNAFEMILGADVKAIGLLGERKLGPFTVRGLRSYHDKSQGKLRGENVVYIIEGPLTVAHLGDLGHLPEGKLADEISRADILLVPVGGVYTIGAYEAWRIIEETNPPIVIPMHFWVSYSTVPLDPLDKFLNIAKARRLRLESNQLEISRGDLPEKTTIVVFPPPHVFGSSRGESQHND
jgi:L-ascorbate metabolism protein UlaG (beta-lactamase superfamily)